MLHIAVVIFSTAYVALFNTEYSAFLDATERYVCMRLYIYSVYIYMFFPTRMWIVFKPGVKKNKNI